MNIHKQGIALSGRFCRLEHTTHTHITQKEDKYLKYESEIKHHPWRRQVPQVRIWNQTPPRKKTSTSSTNLKPNITQEENKYLKYESETKHHPGRKQVPQVRLWNQTLPRKKTSTSMTTSTKHQWMLKNIRKDNGNSNTNQQWKKIHHPPTSKKTQRHVKLQNIIASLKQSVVGNKAYQLQLKLTTQNNQNTTNQTKA